MYSRKQAAKALVAILVIMVPAQWGCSKASSRGTLALIGRVTCNFQPVVGATVRARSNTGTAKTETCELTAQTDALGQFKLDTAGGEYFIEVSDAVHAPAYARSASGLSEPLELTMVPAGAIHGRVIARDGIAVEGATIDVEGELALGTIVPGTPHARAQAAKDGEFTINLVRPGLLRVSAQQQGARASKPAVLTLTPGGMIADLVLELERGFEVSGRIWSTRSSQQPIANTAVFAVDPLTGATFVSTASSDLGEFTFGALYPGSFVVDARGSERLSLDPRLDVSGQTGGTLAISAVPAFRIEGALDPALNSITLERLATDGGGPSVTRDAARPVVVSDGHFAFDGIGSGKIALHASGPHGACGDTLVDVADRDVANVVFRPRQAASIVGVVRDSRGNGLANARVEVLSAVVSESAWRELRDGHQDLALEEARWAKSRRLQSRHVLTQGDGSFEATCLEPGAYELTASVNGRQLSWKDVNQPGGPDTPVIVQLEQNVKSLRVDLATEACDASIFGKVIDQHGGPRPDVWIDVAIGSAAESVTTTRVSTGPSGEYRVDRLCRGQYRLIGHSVRDDQRTESATIDLTAGATENVRLHLDRPVSLHGQVSASHATIRTFDLLLKGPETRAEHYESTDGTFVSSPMVAGRYTAIIEAEDGYVVRTLDLSSGESSRVNFDLLRWSSVSGQVRDEHGQPAAELPVRLYFDRGEGSASMEEAWPLLERLRGVRTDRAGRFALNRVPQRRGRVSFGAPAGEHFIVDATGSSASVPVQSYPRLGLVVAPAEGESLDLGTLVIEQH